MVEKDIKLGRIRADVDPDLVVDIIYTLNLHILTRYYKADNKDELAKKVCEVIRIIKEDSQQMRQLLCMKRRAKP